MSEPARAQPELEKAQGEAGSEAISLITVQNMLGVTHYLLGQASTALHYHLQCLYGMENGKVKDLSLRLSILHNLANDYWALRDVDQAIATYRRALLLVEDLNGIERQASLFWALALSYRTANDWAQAKLYATRALHLYERLDDEIGAASVCLHLGEILIGDSRFDEAQSLLDKAGGFLDKNSDPVLSSNLYTDYAELHRKKGDLNSASEVAMKGLASIRAVAGKARPFDPKSEQASSRRHDKSAVAAPPINVIRAYAEALHISALVEEERGNRETATNLFEEAKALVQGTGLTELAHTIVFSYGNILSARGAYKEASEHYKLAAELGAKPTKPTS